MSNLTFDQYQEQSKATAVYPTIQIIIDGGEPLDAPWLYPLLGLMGECGELSEKFKKVIRDEKGQISEQKRDEIQMERGDPLWYLARLAEADNRPLSADAQKNLDKLADRKKRGVLGGSGDNR
jgi:NTP pyrophosphatase (non-canonical NTP hydrolase)